MGGLFFCISDGVPQSNMVFNGVHIGQSDQFKQVQFTLDCTACGETYIKGSKDIQTKKNKRHTMTPLRLVAIKDKHVYLRGEICRLIL